MGNSRISVITPSFNQAEFIRQTIDSVLAQNYANFEHIVVDGGSTDGTVEILKSYPHLQWTSAKDNGQTDALNKGLAKASGDIIAWLNSDDWYPPGVFDRVVHELSTHSVVIGQCDITDRVGNTTYRVPNVERTWFDILKHWIPYSIPTQPAIFFRRSLLEEVKRADGLFMDNELHFCMDLDLWLRLFQKHPFHRVDQLFAYYRMYEDNKTGGTGTLDAAKPEMARLFKRYEALQGPLERTFSVIIPLSHAENLEKGLLETVESVLKQRPQNFEILCVDYSESLDVSRQIRQGVRELSRQVNICRYVKASRPDFISGLNSGVEQACARYLAFLEPGSVLPEGWLNQAEDSFTENKFGVFLSTGKQSELHEHLKTPEGLLRLDGIFSLPDIPWNFAVRRILLQDLGGFSPSTVQAFALRDFCLHTLFKGWNLSVSEFAPISGPANRRAQQFDKESNDRFSANAILRLTRALHQEPFAGVRLQHGCALGFDTQVLESARRFLGQRGLPIQEAGATP